MTDKVNPSINRPAEAFATAGAIAYGGNPEGYVIPANETTEISIQDSGINDNALNAFDETSSSGSLQVTIDPGEAFVFGAWLAIDTQTNVTLAPSTSNQVVYVGWNKNGADDVIVGLESTFSDASGDADQKIPLWTFNTDSSGVTDVTDSRSFDQFRADSIQQGPGSGFDADTVDGLDASALSTDVSDSGSQVLADVSDINFGSNLGVSDDGDGSVTVDLSGTLGADVSNDGSTVTSSASDIDFTTNLTASDDGDGTATVAIDDGPGSGLDADTVDGVEASDLGSDVSNDGTTVTSSSTDLNFTTGITASDDGDGTSTVALSDTDVTVAGNTVSLGGSTAVDHADLSNIGADDHHAKYTDAEAVSAVNAEATLTVDISGDADTLDGEDADAFLAVSGDTMDGNLQMDNNGITNLTDPTNPKDAANKTYVDSTFVDVAGDTMTGSLSMSSNTVSDLATPTQSTDAATKAYVDSTAEGLDIKDAVRVCTCNQGNIDLSSSTDPNPIDTVTLNDGDRILLIEQTDKTENGIYDAVDATDPTTWTRSADADEDDDVNSGLFTLAVEGSISGNVGFILITPDPITLGTTELDFTRFSGIENITAGTGLNKSGSTLTVDEDYDFTFTSAVDFSAGLDTQGDITDGSEVIWDASNEYVPQSSVEQGSGSGLDADTVDGIEAAALAPDVSNDGSVVTNSTGDINFGSGVTATDDGDGTSTVVLTDTDVIVAGNTVSLGGSTSVDHADLANIASDDHHAKYTDAEAVGAVSAETSLDVDISGDANSVGGQTFGDIFALLQRTNVS